ncbi:phosphoribosyl-AMP cyclohydrolase [Methanobrevibacter sp. DSM 116169]|uniref:phosphoribosyl-AMP cyclohydrolase n=1 Tax=Methanobrevibacter sp. DSM 116169 TaxID=3242727 RepID=UPI0038FC4F91
MNINFRHEIAGEKVITAIAQDYKTGEILMVANMNKEALKKTLETKKAHYWSTSRRKQWLKGESSGHIQYVKEIFTDCDADAIVMKVEQNGAACHEGYGSCFFRKLNLDNDIDIDNLKDDDLEVIAERLLNPEDIY